MITKDGVPWTPKKRKSLWRVTTVNGLPDVIERKGPCPNETVAALLYADRDKACRDAAKQCIERAMDLIPSEDETAFKILKDALYDLNLR